MKSFLPFSYSGKTRANNYYKNNNKNKMAVYQFDFQVFRNVLRQVEENEMEHRASPFKHQRRFTDENWTKYREWQSEWLDKKINKEKKIELDDLDLQEYRQLANQFLKPVKPQNRRRKN